VETILQRKTSGGGPKLQGSSTASNDNKNSGGYVESNSRQSNCGSLTHAHSVNDIDDDVDEDELKEGNEGEERWKIRDFSSNRETIA
jgi:hypothetical protein